MLKKAVLLIFVLFVASYSFFRVNICSSFVSALEYSGTDVGGAITTNTTWTLSGSPYRVTADILVLVGVSLNIEPGVTVNFENGTSIVVDGTFTAQGDSAHRILFTTNLPSLASGDWGSIRTRTGGRIVSVEWATIEYSSGGIEFPADSSGIVSDCVFRENGVGISGSNVNITRCTFERNANGVNAANAQVMDCEFFNNSNGIVGSGAVQNTNVWNNSAGGISISGSVANCSIYSNAGPIADQSPMLSLQKYPVYRQIRSPIAQPTTTSVMGSLQIRSLAASLSTTVKMESAQVFHGVQ